MKSRLAVGGFNFIQAIGLDFICIADFILASARISLNDQGVTYHAYLPENPRARRIDYCFANEKVTPKTQVLMLDTVDGMFPSDHYGLYNEVAL